MTLKELVKALESTGLSNDTEIKTLTMGGLQGVSSIHIKDYSDGQIQIILIPETIKAHIQ